MSKVKIKGNASGTGVLTIEAPNTNDDSTITLPDGTGELIQADASGNVGIGVTPESWKSNSEAFDIGARTSLSDNEDYITDLCNNAYYDGSYKYKDTEKAVKLHMYDGKAKFKVAPSGTADSAISWTDALQITNDGRGLSQFTAKAWINLDGTGTIAIQDSHNVSSVTDNGTGHYEINWSNNMANDDYSVSATSGHLETGNQTDSYSITSIRGSGISSGKVEIQCIRARFDVQVMGDPYIVCLVAFGD